MACFCCFLFCFSILFPLRPSSFSLSFLLFPHCVRGIWRVHFLRLLLSPFPSFHLFLLLYARTRWGVWKKKRRRENKECPYIYNFPRPSGCHPSIESSSELLLVNLAITSPAVHIGITGKGWRGEWCGQERATKCCIHWFTSRKALANPHLTTTKDGQGGTFQYAKRPWPPCHLLRKIVPLVIVSQLSPALLTSDVPLPIFRDVVTKPEPWKKPPVSHQPGNHRKVRGPAFRRHRRGSLGHVRHVGRPPRGCYRTQTLQCRDTATEKRPDRNGGPASGWGGAALKACSPPSFGAFS